MPDFPWEAPLGATAIDERTTQFRVWAPDAQRVRIAADGHHHDLAPEGHGVYAAQLPVTGEYAIVLDDADPLPDPASRWQPGGLRGPSHVFAAPATRAFTPPALADLVVYELHIGTFTPAGTFDSAIERLDDLVDLGVNAIEVMPVAEFPGRHGWGYDGVYLNAAQSSYGGPAAFARLIDAAHARGLAVILDVVYNHLGASGQQAIAAFGPYFTSKYETFWGKALNYDDAYCDPVREWVCQSAEYWCRDMGIDGLRLDAIHAINDASAEHLVQAVARRVHAIDPRKLIIAESGLNDPKVIDGWGCDAQWADDFHHALRVLLTSDNDGYYADFGSLADLAKAFDRPFVHDGSYSEFRHKRFGAPAGHVDPKHFVVFNQDHDQVGNRAFGDRMPVEARPLAALLTILSPFVPMLFQGEEHGEHAPFQFFCDHIDEDIAQATREGRRREFASFAAFAGEEIPDPQDPATFERSKLTRTGEPAGIRDLYKHLLRVRPALGPVTRIDAAGSILTVERGEHTIIANFSDKPADVPSAATRIAAASHAEVVLEGDVVRLPPRAGALVA